MSKITRRDFINGTLMVAGSAMLPFGSVGQAALAALEPSYYPPALTGLRGDNAGSYTSAHRRALAGKSSWGPTTDLNEEYDLVVVGGGLSGLAAAFFYQQEHGRDKKVLILDSHADFGGQCARNEHTIGDSTRLIFGGSQTIVSPHARSRTTLKLLNDLGIDLVRLKAAYDVDFYKRHNLRGVTYFNKRKFGEDKVVKHPFCYYQRFVQGLLRPELSYEEAVRQTPLSEKGKDQLLRVLKGGVNVLDVPREKLENYISTHCCPINKHEKWLGLQSFGTMKFYHKPIKPKGNTKPWPTSIPCLPSFSKWFRDMTSSPWPESTIPGGS